MQVEKSCRVMVYNLQVEAGVVSIVRYSMVIVTETVTEAYVLRSVVKTESASQNLFSGVRIQTKTKTYSVGDGRSWSTAAA